MWNFLSRSFEEARPLVLTILSPEDNAFRGGFSTGPSHSGEDFAESSYGGVGPKATVYPFA
jgi:hypothetical protein